MRRQPVDAINQALLFAGLTGMTSETFMRGTKWLRVTRRSPLIPQSLFCVKKPIDDTNTTLSFSSRICFRTSTARAPALLIAFTTILEIATLNSLSVHGGRAVETLQTVIWALLRFFRTRGRRGSAAALITSSCPSGEKAPKNMDGHKGVLDPSRNPFGLSLL